MMLYDNYSDIDKQNIIKDLYISKQKSFEDIAKAYGTYANKIRRDAIKFKINIRDKSEAQKNALKTGKHKHPTKGSKRTEDTKMKIGKTVMETWEHSSEKEKNTRKKRAKKLWDSLSQVEKDNRLNSANKAVRHSSKVGSKLEHYILNKLIQDGYKTEFHKEQILSNTKLQIDLFLPIINTAIEIDGPSHFLPVWGQESLTRNQKYDNKKSGLLIGKGLNLIRIKQTHDFSKARAEKVYQNLKQILLNPSSFQTSKILEIED